MPNLHLNNCLLSFSLTYMGDCQGNELVTEMEEKYIAEGDVT